ncbi:GNAT family N-acetyltransferase [Lactiplantibacillus mudanjiangensis]|uniref:GNAT family N-acetyltransferase [Lactobacillus sp.] n=1 Tax=Lactiplantibacillus mudanjiangensis TaxID=1296538 RepID=A0A660E285_9LACO|nr:GNAT family N-acetyltransferase [Lactiplantibacillus mudanjiangensis]VDG26282.1 GNAT family N-acetyltransferase [Lactobacillus sp.] [Lactiplantibacillus mudanjiangensis]VDG29444.1 GNAT family N-acetyltransferase [Lactobacillus sp.] [Lactiplantibacillus mudanjiangensis]
MQIRLAQPTDAAQIAPLVGMIYRDMEMPVLAKVSDADLLAMLTTLYQRPENLTDLAQTLVAVDDDQVLGVAFGHPAANEVAVNQLLRAVSAAQSGFDAPLELGGETQSGEWYLSMLAVSPQAQGKGIGSQLLQALPAVAKDQGLSRLSLNVDDGNPKAAKLYHRQGFETVGKLVIGVHPYAHMVKKV